MTYSELEIRIAYNETVSRMNEVVAKYPVGYSIKILSFLRDFYDKYHLRNNCNSQFSKLYIQLDDYRDELEKRFRETFSNPENPQEEIKNVEMRK